MPVRAGLRAQVGIEYELRPDRTMKRARACWYVGRTTVMVQVLASVYSAWGFGLLSAMPVRVFYTPAQRRVQVFSEHRHSACRRAMPGAVFDKWMMPPDITGWTSFDLEQYTAMQRLHIIQQHWSPTMAHRSKQAKQTKRLELRGVREHNARCIAAKEAASSHAPSTSSLVQVPAVAVPTSSSAVDYLAWTQQRRYGFPVHSTEQTLELGAAMCADIARDGVWASLSPEAKRKRVEAWAAEHLASVRAEHLIPPFRFKEGIATAALPAAAAGTSTGALKKRPRGRASAQRA